MRTVLGYTNQLLGNLDYFAILALSFLAAASVAVGIFLVCAPREVIANRLARLMGTRVKPVMEKPALIKEDTKGLMAKITTPLHNIVAPDEEAVQKKIRLKLLQAGFRSRQAYRSYLAAKVLGALILPASYLFGSVFYTLTLKTFSIIFILTVIGFFIPNLILMQITQKRQQRILRAIPDALDLLVVCVEAGLGLDMSIKRVAQEIRPLCKDLSDEFHLTNYEVKAGKSREESMKNMALRAGVKELSNLVAILNQTNRLGTSLGKTLRVHAEGMRTKRRQVAEEKAAKTAVKLLFPLIFFIFPAMFVVLIGPAAIRIAENLLPALGGP